MTPLLLRCGVIGPVLFVVVFTLDGATRSGYRPWRHFVSLLARGERGWVQAVNFVVCGSLVGCFAVGLARTGDSVALPVLFAIFAAGLVASGLFPCDAGLGYPPGALATWPRTATPTGNRHNLAGVLVFGSLIAAAIVVGVRSSGGFAIYSIASGVLVLVAFFVAGALAASVADERRDPPIGIAQRVSIVVGWTWIVVFALEVTRRA